MKPRRNWSIVLPPLAAGLLIACGADGGGRTTGSGDGITGVGSDGEDGGGDSGASQDGGDDSGSGGDGSDGPAGGIPKFDVGGPEATGEEEEEGCTKVDFLFVVDNSGSMSDNQTNLISNFPGFAEEIQDTLVDVDSYHVGVVTTDAYFGNEAGCTTMGALITQTAGADSSNAMCGPGGTLTYAEGNRYMTEADDLPARFACAGRPGTNGDSTETHADAIMGAVSVGMNQPGACNAGFLRADALLIIVIISDEDDDSLVLPAQWFDAVVQAKGVEENVVVLSIVSTVGTPYPATCTFEETGQEIITFTEMFTNGFVGDVCAADYGVVFQDALGLIESACDNFHPPG